MRMEGISTVPISMNDIDAHTLVQKKCELAATNVTELLIGLVCVCACVFTSTSIWNKILRRRQRLFYYTINICY